MAGSTPPRVEPQRAGSLLRFERFELDERLRELRRNGVRIKLDRKPMALLRYLIEHRDRVVPKAELLRQVWPGVAVSDDALQTAVRDLRRALGERGRQPGLIQTFRGDGYRFTADVRRTAAPSTLETSRASSILVERDAELTRLRRLLEASRAGCGRTCVVLGPAGIGKTRIALEAARIAEGLGMVVHAGRCSSLSGGIPFAPWAQLVRACLHAATGAELEAWIRQAGPALQPFLPESAHVGAGALQGLDGPQAHYAVANGFVQLFATAARAAPRLIVLEDLHWADPDSVVVLDLLAQSLADVPLLLLVTLRSDEPRTPELWRALDMLARAPGSEQIPLEALSSSGVQRLLEAAASSPPAPSLASKVHGWTGGNPLGVTELLPLYARGELDAAAAGLGPLPVPHGIRALIELRLAARSEPCQRALRSASVLGEEFSLELLARTTGVPCDALVDGVSEAEATGILHEIPGRAGVYRYAHSLWRESLYAELPRVEARRLHLGAARALEALVPTDRSAQLVDLAHHFLEAVPLGAAASASRYALRAVMRALELHSYQTALKLAGKALEALGGRPDVDPRDRAELYMAYVQSLTGLGSDGTLGPMDDAIAGAAEAALRLARETDDVDLLVRAICLRCDVALMRFHLLPFAAADPSRLRELEELMALLREAYERSAGQRTRARLKLLLSLSSAHWQLRERAAAHAYLEEAERLAHERQEIVSRMNVAVVHALCSGPDSVHASLEHTAQLLRAAEADGSFPAMGMALLLRLPLLAGLGRMAETREAVCTAEAISHQLFHHVHPIVGLVHCMLELLRGRFEHAEARIQELEAVSRRIPYGSFLAFAAGLQRIWLRLWQGRSAEVLHPLQVICGTFPGTPAAHLVLARCYVDVARIDAARSELDRAWSSSAFEAPFDREWIFIHALAAELVHLLDETPRAASLYEKLRPYADRVAVAGGATLPIGSVSRALGLLAATQGCLDLAVDHLETAALQHESIDSPPLLAWTRVDLARVLRRRGAPGDSARSRRLVRDAVDTGHKLGMGSLAASAAALL